MKTKIFILFMVPMLFLYASDTNRRASSPADLAQQYKIGINSSLSDILEGNLDENSNIIVQNNVINKTNNYDKKGFLELVKRKTFGNVKDEAQVSNLYSDAGNAAYKIENTGGKIKNTSYITCIKSGQEWKIVNVIMSIDKIAE